MRANVCNGGAIAATAICLALLSPTIHAGDALAQHAAPERLWSSRSISHGMDAHASGTASQASPSNDSMGDMSGALPGTLSKSPSESKGVPATRLERVLRSISDPSQSEADDVYFLVLAVLIYLGCLLVAEHRNAAQTKDDVGTRGQSWRSDRARGDGGGAG